MFKVFCAYFRNSPEQKRTRPAGVSLQDGFCIFGEAVQLQGADLNPHRFIAGFKVIGIAADQVCFFIVNAFDVAVHFLADPVKVAVFHLLQNADMLADGIDDGVLHLDTRMRL